MTVKSEFLNTLQSRGFIHQCTDLSGLDGLFHQTSFSGYIGFDCTADSLHVGSLLPIMMLRHLQKSGHKPIVLMGGGTTRIGDPSGKDEARQALTDDVISQNMRGIQSIFTRYLSFGDGKTDAMMVNNADWLDDLDYVGFLRDFGRHFSINRMLTMDSVKSRLDREQPLSFLEFNYMIMQAYDFLELRRRHGCILQMGGSDQWGNIISGVDLIRRVDQKQSFGLTAPLLTTASGAKMGKTATGAVWLNAERLSPYDFWQYWRNTEDGDVGRFLRLFTELPIAEIVRLEKLQGSELNQAKKILADAATALCHGTDAAKHAAETAQQVFEMGGAGGDLPVVSITAADIANGIAVYQLIVSGKLATSNSEARRLIKSGSVKIGDTVISDDQQKFDASVAGKANEIRISVGKKKHALIKLA